jgi:hypothetical protein
VGNVVDADQDHGDVRLGRQRPVDLTDQVGGAGSDEGVGAQVDAAVGLLGQPAGQQRTGGLDDALDAVARRGGVAEQRDLDGRAGAAPAVPAGRVGRLARRLADRPTGQLRLCAQQTVEPCPEHGQAPAAVRRGRRQLACRSRCPHVDRLRTAVWCSLTQSP